MVMMKTAATNCMLSLWFVLTAGVLLINPAPLLSQYLAPPLLLSLDVEKSSDVQSLSILDLKEPATYFVTGRFASNFPETVRELSRRGTIGSHSHDHLRMKELEPELVRKDLLASSQAIEAATGMAPVWFRAPFLEFNSEILSIAYEVGFRYDSSMNERWVQQKKMSELPISINSTGRILFSDYNIFATYGLDSEMALNMLKENYLDRAATDRPFIFLLHPSIIAQHKDLLYRFIDFVKQQGGACLSFDQYINQVSSTRPFTLAIHLDTAAGNPELKQIVSDLKKLGVTDVFINMQELPGDNNNDTKTTVSQADDDKILHLVNTLKEDGFRVHGSLNALFHPSSLPENILDLSMVDRAGNRLPNWRSPASPVTHTLLKEHVSYLVGTYPLDGIHLQYLTYPSLEYDYSPLSLRQFSEDTSLTLSRKDPATLLTEYYSEWISWRFTKLAEVVKSAADAIATVDKSVQLSASLKTEALINFKEMETSGQDYRLLANSLDSIVLEPIAADDQNNSFSYFSGVSKAMVGEKPLLISFPAGENHAWTKLNFQNFLRQRELPGSAIHGVILPSYNKYLTYFLENDGIFENLYAILQADRREHTPASSGQTAMPQSVSTQPLNSDQSPSFGEGEKSSLNTSSASLQPQSIKKLLPLILSAGILVLLFVLLTSYRYRQSFSAKRLDLPENGVTDWRQMEESIVRGTLDGPLVHAVAKHLRKYDPVKVSKYRVALIISIVADSEKDLSIDELMAIDFDLPGWQILAMSHLKEALMHNYLQLFQDKITITRKGLHELESMQKKGFASDHWIFVEKRLHENLIITCPYCSAENTVHWYWPKFTCASCSKEVHLRNCDSDIEMRAPGIELDQHYYS